ncbi:MAG: hypothetical protein Q8R18_01300 [bacterium]|nr:hypothetical protein [bacterium]
MVHILEIRSRDGKNIRLTQKQWLHIVYRHPEISPMLFVFESTLMHPHYVHIQEDGLRKYYRFLKKEKLYIMIAVRICNGDGFIITCYFTKGIDYEKNDL